MTHSDFSNKLKVFGINPNIKDTHISINELIKVSIDMDTWKHSWHNDITYENYEKFKSIIQDKIIDRATEIDYLFTAYFQIVKQLSKDTK